MHALLFRAVVSVVVCWLVDCSIVDCSFCWVRCIMAVVVGALRLLRCCQLVGCRNCCIALLCSPVASVVNCWLVDGFNFDRCFCQVRWFIAVGMGHCAC